MLLTYFGDTGVPILDLAFNTGTHSRDPVTLTVGGGHRPTVKVNAARISKMH